MGGGMRYTRRSCRDWHAVREAQNGLHMRAAGRSWEGRSGSRVAIFRPVAVAPPGDGGDLLVDVRLALRTGVACDHVKVARERDLGVVDLLVVRLESSRVDLGVGVTVHVVKRRGP